MNPQFLTQLRSAHAALIEAHPDLATDDDFLADVSRLAEKCTPNSASGCWEFMGARCHKGYGMMRTASLGGRVMRSHRVAFWLTTQTLPKYVCHSCDNPSCCNPAHLFAGDAAINAADRESKGRGVRPSGSAHHRAKITDDVARHIRAAAGRGELQRDISARLGISKTIVQCVCSGKTWRAA